jgi:hypothetical protein
MEIISLVIAILSLGFSVFMYITYRRIRKMLLEVIGPQIDQINNKLVKFSKKL